MDVRATIEAIWRIDSPKVVARLARMVGDVGIAEDLAQDALVAALELWPESGVPDNPGAWLMATGKNRAIDLIRRNRTLARKQEELSRELVDHEDPDLAAGMDDVGDDLLGLVFTCCHPILPAEARVALTLRLVGGLTTPEVARAFLVGEAALAQRLVRAKRTLTEARVPFEVPTGDDRVARLRPGLCEDALRLARVLARLMPREPEVHGLVALLELQASRLAARVDAAGDPVLLADQDRSRWDRLLIGRGLEALDRAVALRRPLGPYALQAAIAACHARARSVAETDWQGIVALYDALAQVAPSPVVELNRAVAVAQAFGPALGLESLDAVAGAKALRGYHLLPAVRGDLLERLGRFDEARAEFERAAAMTANARERALLLDRAVTAGVTQTP